LYDLPGDDSLRMEIHSNVESDLINCVVTLVDLQLDAQNSCLFTYNTFINP